MKNIVNFGYFKKYKKYADYLLKGIYAGIMIGIGALAYLFVEDHIVGSFLFSLGLLTVCMYGMNLFTGKIGYILECEKEYYYELILGLIGNFIGAFCVGKVILLTRFGSTLRERAYDICALKLSDSPLGIFVLSMFCGMLIYIAVNNYKKINTEIGKYIGIFMCVMVFILCGFEHCVANMAYFTVAGVWNWQSLLAIVLMILGNAWGSIIISWFYNLYYK